MPCAEGMGENPREPLRILFATMALPFPPNNGQRMRNWGLLRAMAEEGHRVSLLSFAEPHELSQNLFPLREICEDVRLVPSPFAPSKAWKAYWARFRSLLSPLPYGAIRYHSAAMESALVELIGDRQCDVVICDNIYQFRNLPPTAYDRVLLNKHDFTFIVMRRLLAETRNPLKLAYGWTEYRRLRRWEMSVCEKVARVLVCSELDARILNSALPSVPADVVPNVIDVASYQPRDDDDGRTLLFFGAMDYHANEDAVDFFVSRVLPEVRKANSDARFVAAGRNPSDALLRRYAGAPGVEFTGTVEDMEAVIAQATVCVVPLRIGSGTRLKILEAAAMRKAIVSTHVGAEGLDLDDGREIQLADEPSEFARAVCELLSNPQRRRTLGEAARTKVVEKYSLAALRGAIRKALNEMGAGAPLASPERDLRLARERARA